MDENDEFDADGEASRLRRMIYYLANRRTPQRIARKRLANGFRHGREAPPFRQGEVTSVNQLSQALGYRSNASLYPPKGRLPEKTELSIRSLYEIDDTTRCWRCFCDGDVQGFEAEYERLHAGNIAEEAETTRAPEAARRDTALVPLQWDAAAEAESTSTPYASITLRTGNSPPDPVPGQVHLGFDLHCPEDQTDPVKTRLKRCRLIFDCAGGRTGPLSTRTGNAGGVEYDGARFSTRGTSITEPAWDVTATGPDGIGKIESVPADFICIDGLKPGSTVKARIRASVKEILSTFVVPEESTSGASDAKRRIKARLRALPLTVGDDGEADFATSGIVLMPKPGAAEPDAED